jgi:hypothetical protein
MIRRHGISLLLLAATSTMLAACGGGSSRTATPSAVGGDSLATRSAKLGATQAAGTAGQTPGAAQQSPAADSTQTAGTPPSATSGPDGVASAVPGAASPVALLPDVTVNAGGTATNSQGTPVPDGGPAATGTPQPVAQGTAGVRISIEAPAEASDDFAVDVKVDDVVTPYVTFNVYVTFDPAVVVATNIRPGTALAQTQEAMLCAKAPAVAGTVGLGCTILERPSAATNGVLATIRFHRVGAGTAQLHLRTVAEGAASTGTYIVTPQAGASPLPDIVRLSDATVTVS